MKKYVLVAAMAGSLVSGEAIAACTGGTRLDAAAISALLGGKTVCVPMVTIATMTWQELHVGNTTSTTGALIDYKRGPGHPVDPSETVGTWTVNGTGNGNSTVTHAYGSGGSYIYSVHGNPDGSYSFCPLPSGTEIFARVKLGGGAC